LSCLKLRPRIRLKRRKEKRISRDSAAGYSGAQEYKTQDKRTQEHKNTITQEHEYKNARTQEHKITGAEEHKDTRAQQHKST
jgi:hypothetical protein